MVFLGEITLSLVVKKIISTSDFGITVEYILHKNVFTIFARMAIVSNIRILVRFVESSSSDPLGSPSSRKVNMS